MKSSLNNDIFVLLLDEVDRQGDRQTLQTLRLTCSFLKDLATQRLFRCVTVSTFDPAAGSQLAGLAGNEYIASSMRVLYHKPPNDERQMVDRLSSGAWKEYARRSLRPNRPNHLANSDLFQAFRNLSTVAIKFADRSMQATNRALSDDISLILPKLPPSLRHLRLSQLGLENIGVISSRLPRKGPEDRSLFPNLTELSLVFVESLNFNTDLLLPYTFIDEKGRLVSCLSTLLSHTPNLTALRLHFQKPDQWVHGTLWSTVQLPKLVTLCLGQLAIGKDSLLEILASSRSTLTELELLTVEVRDDWHGCGTTYFPNATFIAQNRTVLQDMQFCTETSTYTEKQFESLDDLFAPIRDETVSMMSKMRLV